MNVIPTRLPGVVVIEPRIFRDARGYFLETWNQGRYEQAGLPSAFLQDNLSHSEQGVLRGLHLQVPNPQAKLVSVASGVIFDVAVDVRAGSPTFGQWVGITLDADDHSQLFVPAGFAHGFVVVKGPAKVSYKVDAPYSPKDELTILWNDPDLAIDWPFLTPTLSEKDQQGLRLRDLTPDRLPS